MVDLYLQAKRDGAAAKRFFNQLIRSHGGEPGKVVTDKLRSYRDHCKVSARKLS